MVWCSKSIDFYVTTFGPMKYWLTVQRHSTLQRKLIWPAMLPCVVCRKSPAIYHPQAVRLLPGMYSPMDWFPLQEMLWYSIFVSFSLDRSSVSVIQTFNIQFNVTRDNFDKSSPDFNFRKIVFCDFFCVLLRAHRPLSDVSVKNEIFRSLLI